MSDFETYLQALKPILTRVRTDVTAVKLPDGTSRWTNEPLNRERLARHFTDKPRGVCPIKEGQNTTQLALLDLDSHGGETSWDKMVEVAERIIDTLALDGYHGIPWRSSGGRGIHIYFIWDEPQCAYSVRQMLTSILGLIGIKNGANGVANGQVEVFPKQDEVLVGEFGNQFILPLSGKSEPLDPLMGYMPMGRDWAPKVEWTVSEPVPVLERPVVDREAQAAGSEPLERVRSALFAIPNDTVEDGPDYDAWRDLAFSVHEATGGSDEGRELFIEWSQQNPKFDPVFFDKRVWPYIKGGEQRSRAITRSTLFATADRGGWMDTTGIDTEGFDDVPFEVVAQANAEIAAEQEQRQLEKYEAKNAWKKAIEAAADEFALREHVCEKIQRDSRLTDIDREVLAEAIKVRFAGWGAKLTIATCRKLVAAVKVRQETRDVPHWCEGYVYVTDSDEFFHLDSDERLSMQAFNAKYNRYLPEPDEGEFRKSASWVALEDVAINTVTRCVYLPWAQDVFELDGVQCANLFRPSSLPETAKHFTKEGRKAIDLVMKHLKLLTGDRKEVMEVLLSWMAHNVQKPGVKIRWAPLIKGVEGDGKTLIGRVMAAVLGPSNVKDISPKVLGTDFTGWAQGACIGVLEEIKLTGHNRYDILNALKPYVTNNSVPIHAKGADEYNVINTMNYIAFTNHSDALPLSDTDRRWFIVFTPFLLSSDLQAAVGDVGAYFDELYEAIEKHRSELRKWLIEMPIAGSFKPNGSAPLTQEKQSMIALSVSPDEEAVKAALEVGGPGVTESVICTAYLKRAIRDIDPELDLKAFSIPKVLTKMGWVKVPKQIKWNGAPQWTWVKGLKPDETYEIKHRLNQSQVTGFDEHVTALGEDVTSENRTVDDDLFA